MTLRRHLLPIHRYVGLFIAAFLFLCAITGSLLAFNEELEAYFAPELFRVQPPSDNAKKLDPFILREKVHAAFNTITSNYTPLRQRSAYHSYFMSVSPAINPLTNQPYVIDFDQVFVNPYTGEILGTRLRGAVHQGAKNIMPFVYKLHDSLALGSWGRWFLGIVALLWTLDCFLAPVLTFPTSKKPRKHTNKPQPKSVNFVVFAWFTRWKSAWKINTNSSFFRLNYTFHQASALWLWLVLFIFAWSSVYFNLRSVYTPVMKTLFTHQAYSRPASINKPQVNNFNWYQAREQGRKLMQQQAKEQQFTIIFEDFISYSARSNSYQYIVNSDRDLRSKEGKTRLNFDAKTGQFINIKIPTGHSSGDTLTSYLTTLHMAGMWGMAYKIFVFILGIITTLLCVTGVYLWWKKRRTRKHYQHKKTRGVSYGN